MRNIIEKTANQIEEDLLKNGPFTQEELHQKNKYGATALFYTDPAKTKFLIDVGLDVNHVDNRGRTAFFYADSYSASLLLYAGANPYLRDKKGLSAVDLFLIAHKSYETLSRDFNKFKMFILLDMLPNKNLVTLNDDHKIFIRDVFNDLKAQQDFMIFCEELKQKKRG